MDPILVHQPQPINVTPHLLCGIEGSDPPASAAGTESKMPGGTGIAWFLRLPQHSH